jgi:magnesium transporter
VSEINKEYLDALRGDVEQKHDDALVERFDALHPADIAEAFDALNAEEVSYCFKLLDDKERAANVLVELDEDVREALMERLTNREIIEEVLAYIDCERAP